MCILGTAVPAVDLSGARWSSQMTWAVDDPILRITNLKHLSL